MELIYSEEDQRKIDELNKNIANYELNLMHRINRDGLNWAASSKEMKTEFINDKVRNTLIKSKIDLMSSMIPIKIMTSIKTELTTNDEVSYLKRCVEPVVMKKFKNGMTVNDLKSLLSEWPEKDDRTGEDCEVWIENKEGFTNQCRKATPLNKSECSADLLLSS
jgi:hypothetical protein